MGMRKSMKADGTPNREIVGLFFISETYGALSGDAFGGS